MNESLTFHFLRDNRPFVIEPFRSSSGLDVGGDGFLPSLRNRLQGAPRVAIYRAMTFVTPSRLGQPHLVHDRTLRFYARQFLCAWPHKRTWSLEHLKKPQKKFVVEYKGARRKPVPQSNSIWGSVDLRQFGEHDGNVRPPGVGASPAGGDSKAAVERALNRTGFAGGRLV